jgi:hypothetical protein
MAEMNLHEQTNKSIIVMNKRTNEYMYDMDYCHEK